jgi:BolA protein
MSNRAERIRDLLTSAFTPTALAVRDDSALHAGHPGNPDGAGETHYMVTMTAPAFSGQSRVARSRLVHDALAAEFATGLHALALKLSAPGE